MWTHRKAVFPSLSAVLALASLCPARVASADPADLFGVDLGTTREALRAAVSSGATCKEHGPPTNAIVCSGEVRETGSSAANTTSFWLTDNRVSRIYQLTLLPGRSFAGALQAFRNEQSRLEGVLGRAPTFPAEPEPTWLAELSEDEKLKALAKQRISPKVVWKLQNREVSLSLLVERGAPALVVALEPAQPVRCTSDDVARMLMHLFPPTTVDERIAAAQQLAACRVAGASPALAAAVLASEEEAPRVEAVRALGAMGPDAVRHLEHIAKDTEDLASAKEALGQLANMDKLNTVQEIARAKNHFSPELRKVAQELLRKGTAPPGHTDWTSPFLGAQAQAVDAPSPGAPGRPLPSPSRPANFASVTSPAPVPPTATSAAAPTTVPPVSAALRPVAPRPVVADENPDAEENTAPAGPPDGTALALTTSLLAGGVWGGGLSLLAQQSSPGVVLLVGSAGAIIGGGTAWGLTHFGLRPSPAQAMWFANTTAWGALAGLAAWAGSGSDNAKLKWGLLVGGESLGMGLGVLSARKWDWTASQTLFADSLVIGAGLSMAGIRSLTSPHEAFRISPVAGIAAAPVMFLSAVASRYVAPTKNDLHLLGGASLASAWTGGLIFRGLDTHPSTQDVRLRGGVLAGLGAGYLAAAAAAPFVEISPQRTWISEAGLLAGNAIGLGVHMMATPNDSSRWALGAGIGGLSLGVGTFLAHPHLRLGERAVEMGLLGTLYGAGTWGIAQGVSSDGRSAGARLPGGLLSLGTVGALGGLLASSHFDPDAGDDATAMGSAVMGLVGGVGIAKLATQKTGQAELAGALAGSAAGMAAGATFAHYARLRSPDLSAALLGASTGALAGALLPSLARTKWNDLDRRSTGGLLLGVSGGALAATALSHAVDADSIDIGIGAAGSALGLAMGLGTGLLWHENYSQPARIGAVAGTSAGLLGSLLLERPLRLREGLGNSAVSLALTAGAIGAAEGVLIAGLAHPSGLVGKTSEQAIDGGILLGGSAGLATGLLLSKLIDPTPNQAALVAGGALAGGLLGRGLMMTALSTPDRPDTLGTLVGSLTGTAAAAMVERYSPLSATDLYAASLGLAYGGLVGALGPTSTDAEWRRFGRRSTGELLLGLGGGSVVALSLSHLAQAEPSDVTTAAVGGMLGLGMGLGTGLLWPTQDSQASRIGTVAGASAGMAGALLFSQPLRLKEGSGSALPGLAAVGTIMGIGEGILLAGLLDESGQVSNTPDQKVTGGILLGGSAGLAGGIIFSKFWNPTPDKSAATVAGALAGGVFGRGLAMQLDNHAGRSDTTGALAGSLLGAIATAVLESASPMTSTDLLAAGVGLGYGGLLGALAPSLSDRRWNGSDRRSEGGLLLGVSGGAMGAAILAHASDASPRTIGLGALGGLDGALTGLGVGLLVDSDPRSSRGARIGTVAGTAGGLALGLGLWPRIDFDTDDLILLSAASAVGGWTGLWSQVLGHSSLDDVDARMLRAGLLVGAGGASLLTSALLPVLEVDRDLIGNALALDALWSGAGAGIGALASRRADAPVWGMLGGGTAGLLLGGVLHDAIDFGESRELVAFAALEGLWAGGWMPYVLRPTSQVTDSDTLAGLAAGGLGGAGLAVLAKATVTPASERLHMAGVGSAIGASVAGGSALLLDELHDQTRVGMMLGGTAVGLGLGALLAPYAPLDGGKGQRALAGAGLGLGEGLVFAWSGRAKNNREFAGAGLVGAGLGATLALASGADASELDTQQALVASGFSAWGAWVGSFSGALAHRDSHEVVMGGLLAANLGFLAGYGALRYDLVETRDFGWLSLAGAMGAALGGGLGAALSTSTEPRPVLAGLALGPLVGIGAGAFIVPRLRERASSQITFIPPQRIAPVRFDFGSDARPKTSADILAGREPSRFVAGLKLAQKSLFDVTDVTPIFGALPPVPGDPNGTPFFLGVSGRLR